jgi:hypothetical protein
MEKKIKNMAVCFIIKIKKRSFAKEWAKQSMYEMM